MKTGEFARHTSFMSVFDLVILYEDDASKSILFVFKLLMLKSLHFTKERNPSPYCIFSLFIDVLCTHTFVCVYRHTHTYRQTQKVITYE